MFLDRFAWLTTPNRKHVIENYPFCRCVCVFLYHLVRVSKNQSTELDTYNFATFHSVLVGCFFSILSFHPQFVCSTVSFSSICLSYMFLLSLFQFNVSFNNYCLLPFHTLLRLWCTWTMLDGWLEKSRKTTKNNQRDNNKTQESESIICSFQIPHALFHIWRARGFHSKQKKMMKKNKPRQ